MKPWFPSTQQLDEAFAKVGFARRPEYTGQGGHVYSRGEVHLFVFSWSNPRIAEAEGLLECRLVVDLARLLNATDYRRSGSPDHIAVDYERDQWDTVAVPRLVEQIAATFGDPK